MAVRKPPVDEEAHFRIDEHERRLEDISKVGDSIPDLVNGGVAALAAALKTEFLREIQEIKDLREQDIETDKAVVESNKAIVTKLDSLCGKIDRLCDALLAPTTRTATLDLPSGAATMTVRESRMRES